MHAGMSSEDRGLKIFKKATRDVSAQKENPLLLSRRPQFADMSQKWLPNRAPLVVYSHIRTETTQVASYCCT